MSFLRYYLRKNVALALASELASNDLFVGIKKECQCRCALICKQGLEITELVKADALRTLV